MGLIDGPEAPEGVVVRVLAEAKRSLCSLQERDENIISFVNDRLLSVTTVQRQRHQGVGRREEKTEEKTSLPVPSACAPIWVEEGDRL